MKRIIAIVLSLTMILSAAGFSFADDAGNVASASKATPDEITIYVNGNAITFDEAKPTIINGRTMVPIRKIGEILNAAVAWRAVDRTVHIFRNGKSATLGIDSTGINLRDFECIHDLVYTSPDTGKDIVLDAPPCIIDGRTMVPLRAIVQAFGLTDDCVVWDGSNRTVTITDSTAANYQVLRADKDAADLIENWNYCPEEYVPVITSVTLQVPKNANAIKERSGEEYYILGVNGLQLSYRISPDEATAENAVYKSSDEKVATVDENGFVKRVSKGEASITVEVSGVVSKPIKVKVTY